MENGSQPVHKIKVEKDIYVPMRDGVRLATDVYRPDTDGKFPALLAMSVYGKELQALRMPVQSKSRGSLLWDGAIEAGDTAYIVPRGYVHVIADVRGTGDSEGEHVGVFDKNEQQDGYDMVEWIAQQPWCDGNVGMIGISYFALTQLFTAIQQPPHLKAIFPFEVHTDTYRGLATDGGVIFPMLYRLYPGRPMDAGPVNGSGYASTNVVSATMKNLPEEKFKKLQQERLNDPDLRIYSIYWHVARYPTKNPIFADVLFNPEDGPFWQERTPYNDFDRINIPLFTGGPWTGLWAEGAFDLYSKVNVPKKVLMVPPGTVDRPWYTQHEELIRWMDHWLKGIDTGMMNEPPIKIFVMGANQWRYEQEWPLTRTKWTKLYLRSWERMLKEPVSHVEDPDGFVQEPLTQTSEVRSAKYATLPLSEDTEVTGPMALTLYASIDTEDTSWYIRLFEVDEYGKRHELSSSWLKASHRAVDESKSEPWNPWHPHTSREKLTPGKVYEYRIGIPPISNMIKAGHRIELEIAGMDNVPGGLHICNSRTTVYKIYHDTAHMSHLLLPIIPSNK
jgi:predicted acyl esterase